MKKNKIRKPETSKKIIKKILDTRKYNHLKGLVEDFHFDAKRELQDLSDERKKVELAKDITSFANLEGGYIIYGLGTEEAKGNLGEKVTSIDGIGSFNGKQIKDILINLVHPNILRVLKIYSYKLKGEKHLLVIEISDNNTKPFFVKKNFKF